MAFSDRLTEARDRVAEACRRSGRQAAEVKIIAVTKTATEAQIIEAVQHGQFDLGENRVQVLESHATLVSELPGVRWHMIGHLQRNKVRDVLSIVHSIQSVDSLRLANEIEKEAARVERKIPVLLQLNAGEEHQKFGADMDEYLPLAEAIAKLPHLDLQGLMSMAPLTDDAGLIRKAFSRTREALEAIRDRGQVGENCRELSMGMSGDYEIAVEEGATMVRLGSVLFGNDAR